MDEGDARLRLEAAYPRLRRFAAVVGPPGVDPDDLVHEVFVRALRADLRRIDDLDAYLRRSVLNAGSNHRRRWSRERDALARARSSSDDGDSSVDAASSVDVAELLALAPGERAVLWLAEVEGWSYLEIGQLLGCTDAAARMRATRARRRLRAEVLEGDR